MKYTIRIIYIVLICLSSIGYSGQSITINELLDRYNQTQKDSQAKYIKSETIRKDEDSLADEPKWYICKLEYYTDGTRIDLTKGKWISIADKNDRNFYDSSYSTRLIWDEDTWYEYKKPKIIEDGRVFISTNENWKNDSLFGNESIPLEGYIIGNTKTISSIFHEADEIKLHDTKEIINGILCYVLEADTEYGNHKIWIDPEHGYNICQAEVVRTNDDLYFGKPLSKIKVSADYTQNIKLSEGIPPIPIGSRTEVAFIMNNVKFQDYNGLWIPISGDWQETTTYENGRVTKKSFNHSLIELEISPDFEAVHAFEPNIPNGTLVRIENENIVIPYHWIDNEVEPDVDEIVLEVIDETIEELAQEAPFNNNQSLEIGQTLVNQEGKIVDEITINKTQPVESKNNNGMRNLLLSATMFILCPLIVIVLIVTLFLRLNKRKEINFF